MPRGEKRERERGHNKLSEIELAGKHAKVESFQQNARNFLIAQRIFLRPKAVNLIASQGGWEEGRGRVAA